MYLLITVDWTIQSAAIRCPQCAYVLYRLLCVVEKQFCRWLASRPLHGIMWFTLCDRTVFVEMRWYCSADKINGWVLVKTNFAGNWELIVNIDYWITVNDTNMWFTKSNKERQKIYFRASGPSVFIIYLNIIKRLSIVSSAAIQNVFPEVMLFQLYQHMSAKFYSQLQVRNFCRSSSYLFSLLKETVDRPQSTVLLTRAIYSSKYLSPSRKGTFSK